MRPTPKAPNRKPDGTTYKTLYVPTASGPNKFTSTQMDEDDYLQTETWKNIRQHILQAANFKCAYCGGFAENVHHKKYPDVWGQEHPEDLVPVCEACHAKIHRRKF